jgi:hypothetical protein
MDLNYSSIVTMKNNVLQRNDYLVDLNNPGACNLDITSNVGAFESPSLGTGSSSLTVPIGGISSITLTLPSSSTWGSPCFAGTFKSGSAYSVNILGVYGNKALYFQVM